MITKEPKLKRIENKLLRYYHPDGSFDWVKCAKWIMQLDETPKQVSQNFCEWLEVKEADGIMYETDCENGFICGDYERLYKDYKYCPYCGKPIKIKRVKQKGNEKFEKTI